MGSILPFRRRAPITTAPAALYDPSALDGFVAGMNRIADNLDSRNHRRHLVRCELHGKLRVIAADPYNLGAEHQLQSLREALAECDAALEAIDAEGVL